MGTAAAGGVLLAGRVAAGDAALPGVEVGPVTETLPAAGAVAAGAGPKAVAAVLLVGASAEVVAVAAHLVALGPRTAAPTVQVAGA